MPTEQEVLRRPAGLAQARHLGDLLNSILSDGRYNTGTHRDDALFREAMTSEPAKTSTTATPKIRPNAKYLLRSVAGLQP